METANKTRQLPIFRMGETDFYVDIRLDEFRQVDAPWNRVSMEEIRETASGGTELVFDLNVKNIYEDIIDPDEIPGHVIIVIVPSLKELDPIGLARKHGLPDDTYTNKQNEYKKAAEAKKTRTNRGHKL